MMKVVTMPDSKPRDYYWDNVKAFAILAVILIHTINPLTTPPYGMIFRQFINFPVFLFFALAGYFTHYTSGVTVYSQFIAKKTLRLLPTLLVFSLLRAIVWLYFNRSYDVASCLNALLSLPLGFGYFVLALWQCFIVFPLLLKLPRERWRWFIVVGLTFSSLALLYWLVLDDPNRRGVAVPMPAIFFSTWLLPFYLGYFISHAKDVKPLIHRYRNWLLVLLAVSTGWAIGEAFFFQNGYRLLAATQLKVSTFWQSIFLTLCLVAWQRKIYQPGILTYLGQASFFIYLSHWLFILIFRKVLTFFPSLTSFANMWAIALLVIGAEILTVLIMRRLNIRWLNKLMGIC
jgi:peptidoglycan/LPS O-acetylase OafA/YrhL